MAFKINLGSLQVSIGADTSGLDEGVKKSNKSLDEMAAKAGQTGAALGKWAAAGIAAAAAVGAAIVKSQLSAIAETDNLAKSLGIATAEFERGAFAAKQYGIEQEKYADILKDTNDKMGEFVATGAGPMKEFFDTVGKKVGVTAESFRKLSGPDALQLYVSSLEKAGVNQKEATFFMEQLAGGSARLLPLLRNNGAAMSESAKRAEELGIGMSQIDAAKAVEAQRALAEVSAVIDSQLKQATIELAPYISAIAKEFSDMIANSGGISSFIVPAFEKITGVVGVFADGLHGIQIIFKAIEVVGRGFIAAVATGFDLIIKAAAGVGNAIIEFIAAPFQLVLAAMAPFSDEAKSAQQAFGDFVNSIKLTGVQAVEDFATAQTEAMQTAQSELGAMLEQEIPSSKIEAFIERVKETAKAAAPEIAAALRGDGAGMGGGAVAPVEDVQALEESDTDAADRTQEMFDAMIAESEMRAETLSMRYANEAELLRQGLEMKYLTEQEYSMLSRQLAEDEAAFKTDVMLSTMDALVEAVAIGGKKASKIQKGLAIVNAVIHGKEAAVAAWNAGMSVGGPYAPLVAAAYTAASIARTASMISSIKSGGSSMSGMSGGGGGAGATPAGGEGGGGEGGGAKQAARRVDVNFTGEGLMSTAQVRTLIGQIGEQLGDGIKLNTGGG